MRNRILNCLYREVVTTESNLISELRKDAELLPSNWTPRFLVKTLSWAKNHPVLVRYHLRHLKTEKLIVQNDARLSLSSISHSRMGRYNSAAGEPQQRHLKLVTS